jgi:octaprenyl-diphosphate synthase
MAFQIIDDCLDVMGKEEEMGKPVNLDAQIGKLTLPFIRLVDKLPTDRRKSTLELIFQNNSKDSKAAIADLLAEHDAVDYAYDTAKRLIKDAQENLSVIPDSVYKTSLLELGDYVVSRDR